MSRNLCTVCNRIYTNNQICQLCSEKVYPSKIAVVYPEGSLLQKIAIHAFNHLQWSIDQEPEMAKSLANEFGVPEEEFHTALEVLYTEN